jgi:hypothetical protein
VEDKAFSLCTEKRLQDRRAAGADDGKDENADTDVFCNIGVHNELDLYGTCIS